MKLNFENEQEVRKSELAIKIEDLNRVKLQNMNFVHQVKCLKNEVALCFFIFFLIYVFFYIYVLV